ncbi:hypothetical protein, partial [Devosia sp.]|uniref:hypothetical protein n=1 Tax=Devosia sp. TaxID=1871048 RepID=UPI0026086C9B
REIAVDNGNTLGAFGRNRAAERGQRNAKPQRTNSSQQGTTTHDILLSGLTILRGSPSFASRGLIMT